ncbi:MAG: hypothetical protein ACRDPV_04325 [Gaiellaceae bacterium]
MQVAGRPAVAVVALGVLGLQLVATLVALVANLPSQSGDAGDDAASEFVLRGTAISAPVVPLVVLVVAGLLALRQDRWGAVGTVGILVLSVLIVAGSLSEATAEATPDVSKAVLVASGLVGSAIGVALFVLGILELRRRRRPA